MTTYAAILAAGRGYRFGADKVEQMLGGKPVWRWAFDAYLNHPAISRVILVTHETKVAALAALLGDSALVVAGGSTRQDSSRAALDAASTADNLLVHDAARPFVSADLISRVLAAVERSGAAAAALPVTDTIKQIVDGAVRTLDRSKLVAMQTPQGASIDLLRRAHADATVEATDEMALIEALGVHPEIVPGDPQNFKITTPKDLLHARFLLGSPETRTGIGYDIHRFSEDPTRELWLGGVHFPDHVGLDGHSDADVLLHAATDALLGAASLGDIGQHFPNSDPRWQGQASLHFLRHAGSLLAQAGWKVVNLDVTAIAESPKIMKRADEIRATIAEALGIDATRVSIKATTNERLGSIGRGEGISAFAVATITTA